MALPLFINGRFLAKKITGTERFARETVWALDALLETQGIAADIRIIAPSGTPAPQGLKRIGFATAGTRQGHAWEQWELARAAKRGFLLNLCNSAPVLHSRQLTVLHDATVYRMPENFSFAYGTFHRTLGRILARRSAIATVSEFSRGELARVLKLQGSDMIVCHNGHEHILRVPAEPGVIERLGLKGRPYFLFVGSPVPNKNLPRAIEAFTLLNRPDVTFVIVGASKTKVFKGEALSVPANVLMPGRMEDGEIVALYQHATAMLFPSLYEGFGIPPLEAITLGCPVVASHIPPVREVCGDAALYFDPLSPADMAQKMSEALDAPERLQELRGKGQARYPLFSWKTGAQRMWDKIQPLLEKDKG